jgi:hypothetical protein
MVARWYASILIPKSQVGYALEDLGMKNVRKVLLLYGHLIFF